ncbi:MAG: F-type H+-transporting ATPase subunit b [Rhodospirillaceae bacterium]|nr:MAG: F-type H+-transporting ATPase subunit b [Rhodospirillaceae bacterium]
MLPQFDTAFFPSQLFWLAICFGMLYFLAARLVLPRIAEVLSERQRRIDDDLERASQLKAQMEIAIQAYERALANARREAHVVLQQSQDELTNLIQSYNQQLTERLAREIKRGEARIAAAKQVALGQVKEIAAEVAKTAVERLVGLALEVSRYHDAVAVVVKERM